MRTKRHCLTVLAVLAVTLAFAAIVNADIIYDRTISTTGETLNGTITNNVLITSSGSATTSGVTTNVNGGGLVTAEGNWSITAGNFGLGNSLGSGTLNVDGGTVSAATSVIFNSTSGYGSYLNISAGSFSGGMMYLNQSGGQLYVDQTGGSISSTSFYVGHGGTQRTDVQAEYLISGGQAYFGYLRVGNAGSTLTPANCGSGLFEIDGFWTVQGVTKTIEVVDTLTLYDTLAFNFDTDGVTPIDAGTFALGTTAAADPTIVLDVVSGLTAGDIPAGTYDLVKLTNAWAGSLGDITLIAPDDWTLQMSGDGKTIQVVVPTGENEPPVANAGADQSIEDTDDDGTVSVTLNGTASSDSDGTIVEYLWYDYDGDLIGSGSTLNTTLPVGLHDIGLCVVDDDGGMGWAVVRCWVTPKIDFYVDTNDLNASDANPGTEALPFKTIAKGVTAVTSGSGEAILVKEGIYREALNINRPGGSKFVRNVKAQPGAWFVANWGDRTNITRDFTPSAGSPAFGSGSTGGNMGSSIDWLAYEEGDFNGDGRRDIPEMP